MSDIKVQISMRSVKVKLSLYTSIMTAHSWNACITPLVLNLGTICRQEVSLKHRGMYPRLARLGGAHTRYERSGLRNIVPPTEFETQMVQPVADTLNSPHNSSLHYRYSTNFNHNLTLS